MRIINYWWTLRDQQSEVCTENPHSGIQHETLQLVMYAPSKCPFSIGKETLVFHMLPYPDREEFRRHMTRSPGTGTPLSQASCLKFKSASFTLLLSHNSLLIQYPKLIMSKIKRPRLFLNPLLKLELSRDCLWLPFLPFFLLLHPKSSLFFLLWVLNLPSSLKFFVPPSFQPGLIFLKIF